MNDRVLALLALNHEEQRKGSLLRDASALGIDTRNLPRAVLSEPSGDSEAIVSLLRDLPLLRTHTTKAEQRTVLQ